MSFVVYRHFSLDGELLYIGSSINVSQRTKAHVGKIWFSEIANITLEHHQNRRDALDAERKAIKSESPKYNIMHTKKLIERRKLVSVKNKENIPVIPHVQIDLLCEKFNIKTSLAYFFFGVSKSKLESMRINKTPLSRLNIKRFAFLKNCSAKKIKEMVE